MKTNQKKKLFRGFKGNTLIETVVAMSIIISVLLIATRIIVSLDKSSNPSLQLRAFVLAKNELSKEISNFENITTNEGNLIVKKEFQDCAKSPDIKIVKVAVYSENETKIVELKELVTTRE